MHRVKISELRERLAEYVAAARRGETVVICDQDVAVAAMVGWAEGDEEELRITPATLRPGDLDNLEGVATRKPVDWLAILREGRDQR
jgi:antitoxin (DNA-binding transcriptional repressor) of toxin-antitoxin stability system